MKQLLTTIGMGALVLALAATYCGAVNMPVRDQMESAPLGANWTVSSNVSPNIQAVAGGADGNNCIQLSTNTITMNLAGNVGGSQGAWVRIYADAARYDDDDIPSADDATAAFFVNESDQLKALAGMGGSNGWVIVQTGVPTGFIGYVVHVHFGDGTYDLYWNTNGTYGLNDELVRITSSPLNVGTGASATLTSVSVETEKQAKVDAFAASIDTHGTLRSRGYVEVKDHSSGTTAQVWDDGYYWTAVNDNLLQELGRALMTGMDDNDTANVFDSAGFNPYDHNETTAGWDGGFSTAPSSQDIEWADVVLVARAAISAGFYDYDTETAIGDASGPPLNSSGQQQGFSHVQWPRGPQNQNTAPQAFGCQGIAGLMQQGDLFYVLQNGSTYIRLWWNSATQRWYYRGSEYGGQIQMGERGWFWRQGGGNPLWDVH